MTPTVADEQKPQTCIVPGSLGIDSEEVLRQE
jgi:hypothetical protein